MSAPWWRVAAASVRGASHQAEGTPGQDAHAVRTAGEWLVAVVCDGAGSAALGGLGASVGSAAVAQSLAQSCAQAPVCAPRGAEAFWRRAAVEAVAEARRQVAVALASAPGGLDADGLARFDQAHATLVGAVVHPQGGFFLHIGDGVGVAMHDGATRAVSLPENGAFANETFFFTEPHWDGRLRLTPFDAPLDGLVLMSDGGAALAFQDGALFDGFAGPVGRFLATVDDQAGSDALAETLASPKTFAATGDDKTVVWARLDAAADASGADA